MVARRRITTAWSGVERGVRQPRLEKVFELPVQILTLVEE
jgi:hypothetical protein